MIQIDFGKRTCCECGGPKNPQAGSMCRKCYLTLAKAKRERSPIAIVRAALKEGERAGQFALTQEGWTLRENVSFIDWNIE